MSQGQNVTMEFQVPGNSFDRAGEAAAKIKRMVQHIGVPADIVRRIAIGTYEAEINLIIHAGGGQIEVSLEPELTRIIVKDQGPGIADVKLAMQEGWSTASAEARAMGFGAGMGLPNMVNCSDRFNIESQVGRGTTITMEFTNS